jgi:hypothetical protein
MKANVLRSHRNVLHTQVDLTPALTTRMKSVGITMNLPKTSEECQANLKMVQAAIRKQIKDSVQIRLNEIEDQAELVALDGKSKKTAELRKLQNAEKTATVHIRHDPSPVHATGGLVLSSLNRLFAGLLDAWKTTD